MTTQELKNYINSTLGNTIRCLLPSYWWKRLFGLMVDKVGEVENKVAALPTKEYVNTTAAEVERKVKETITEEVAAAKIPSVETEAELNLLNVPNGTIAQVAGEIIKDFADYFRLTLPELESGMLGDVTINSLLGRVSSIKIIQDAPFNALTGTSRIYLSFGVSYVEYVICFNGQDNTLPKVYVYSYTNGEEDVLFTFCDNDGKLLQSEIDRFNEILSQNDYKYCAYYPTDNIAPGIQESELHKYIVIYEGSYADAYIKHDTWEKLAKEDVIKEYVDNAITSAKEGLSALESEVISNEEVLATALNEINDRIKNNLPLIYTTKDELTEQIQDVTNKIVDNEEITAAALNDLANRIKALEDKIAATENV